MILKILLSTGQNLSSVSPFQRSNLKKIYSELLLKQLQFSQTKFQSHLLPCLLVLLGDLFYYIRVSHWKMHRSLWVGMNKLHSPPLAVMWPRLHFSLVVSYTRGIITESRWVPW